MPEMPFFFVEVALILGVCAIALWQWRKSLKVLEKRGMDLDDLSFSRIAVTHADDGLLVMDMRGIVQWVNPAYCKLMGRDTSEMIGHHPQSFAFPESERPDQATLNAFAFDFTALTQSGLETFRNQRKDGTIFWNQINTSFHTTASGTQFAVSVCRDVTQSIEREERLELTSRELAHSASHDSLTGAGNRALMMRFLEDTLARAQTRRTKVGVFHIDLDKFKQTNDTFGHAAGDAVLVAVAQRLKRAIRETDLVARVGGDEFVVATDGLNAGSDIRAIGTTLLRAVSGPVSWQNNTLDCQISIGAAISGDTARCAETLLLQSDFALYAAKRNGRGKVATYDYELHQHHMLETTLSNDLRNAILGNGIGFHFQPIIAAADGKVWGVETLARWHHPSDGPIASDRLFAMTQGLKLLPLLDLQAANAAIALKERMNAAGFKTPIVSFNAAAETLSSDHFIANLTEVLKTRTLSRKDLVLEVRETAEFGFRTKGAVIEKAVTDLNEIGVSAMIDDFGHGHAGLMHLSKLPIRGVKLDQHLAQQAFTDPVIEKLCRTTIQLCRELGLRVTAKGVETAQQAQHLTELGSHSLQGHWIAPAMSADDLIEWLGTTTDCPRPTPPLSKEKLKA